MMMNILLVISLSCLSYANSQRNGLTNDTQRNGTTVTTALMPEIDPRHNATQHSNVLPWVILDFKKEDRNISFLNSSKVTPKEPEEEINTQGYNVSRNYHKDYKPLSEGSGQKNDGSNGTSHHRVDNGKVTHHEKGNDHASVLASSTVQIATNNGFEHWQTTPQSIMPSQEENSENFTVIRTTQTPTNVHATGGKHSQHLSHQLEDYGRPDRLEIKYENFSRSDEANDLCSVCLCDPRKLNVYCKHEHLNDELSHHLILESKLIPKNATSLHIVGFEKVTITNGTFSNEDLELRRIQFESIQELELTKESFYFNKKARSNREAAIILTSCNIKEIPTETITQYDRSVGHNNDDHLENTRFLSLYIERCNIMAIRSYAVSQARLLYFKMTYTKVDTMEENSFYVDIYEDWIVEHSYLPKLMQHSIHLRTHMIAVFSNNHIGGLENRSLHINSSGQVLFEYNNVDYLGSEALMGIIPNDRGANIVFLNNTVSHLFNRSLILSKNYPLHERKILDNKFDIPCDCNIKGKFQPLMGITAQSDIYDNRTFKAVMEDSHCKLSDLKTHTKIEDYLHENCTPIPIAIIASAATVITVVIITIIICVMCSRHAEKAREEANYLGECCYSNSFSTLTSGNQRVTTPSFANENSSWERRDNPHPWVVAVPEVKTYQETEVHVHYEHTDPLNCSVRGSYHEPKIDFQRKMQARASCPFN